MDAGYLTAEALADAVNWVIEWVKGLIQGAILSIISTVKSLFNSWSNQLQELMICLIAYEPPTNTLDSFEEDINFVDTLWKFLFVPLMAITAIVTALSAIEVVIGAFTFGSSTILSQIVANIVPIIITTLFSMAVVAGIFILMSPNF